MVERNTELIPFHRLAITVTQLDTRLTDVRNKVGSLHHVLRAYAHLVLVVALILVQRVVLVDILHIRESLVTRVVPFCLLVTVRRVTLWHVDAFVAVEDGSLSCVQVSTTEIVVVIVGRVSIPCRAETVVY